MRLFGHDGEIMGELRSSDIIVLRRRLGTLGAKLELFLLQMCELNKCWKFLLQYDLYAMCNSRG